jgi:TPR repeat protein
MPSFLRSETPRSEIPKTPGEEEFLAHNCAVATPLLIKAAGEGDSRAIFYLRIIYEHGLDGGPLRPQLARQAINYLALRYPILEQLASEASESQKALYQTALATLNYLGRGPSRQPDLERAATFLEPALEANYPPAINLMTVITRRLAEIEAKNGDKSFWSFFSFDRVTQFEWAQKGADLKDSLAMANLSALYRQGVDVPQNQLYAATWAHAAATAPCSVARAQNDMGYYYENGLGLAKDPVEATRWYQMAAARQEPKAQANLQRLAVKTPTQDPTQAATPASIPAPSPNAAPLGPVTNDLAY